MAKSSVGGNVRLILSRSERATLQRRGRVAPRLETPKREQSGLLRQSRQMESPRPVLLMPPADASAVAGAAASLNRVTE
jgi:hypothetical protein